VHPQVCISLGCVLTLKGKAVDFSNCPLQPAGYCGVVEQPCRQMESLLSGGALGQLHSVQQKPAPEVSFILTLHNNQDLALKCIWELFATSQEAAGVEFIVIDDAVSGLAATSRLIYNPAFASSISDGLPVHQSTTTC
jgi:hypothetical protein